MVLIVVEAQVAKYDVLRYVRAVYTDREWFEKELSKLRFLDTIATRYKIGREEDYVFPKLGLVLIYRGSKEGDVNGVI